MTVNRIAACHSGLKARLLRFDSDSARIVKKELDPTTVAAAAVNARDFLHLGEHYLGPVEA